jgi:hypothetical protein
MLRGDGISTPRLRLLSAGGWSRRPPPPGSEATGWLYKHRLYWIVGLGILSALGTPGADPITPFFMFIPLYLFFEGTALLLKVTGR